MIKKALATKGYIYPSPQEEAYIWEAAQNPERKRCGGVNLDELTKDVNSLFPESGRSKKQVSRILDRLRRKKGAKTKEKITDEQKDFVIDLAKKYQHRNGRVKRKIVAEKYNDHFHDGKPVRDGVFVNNVLRDYRNKL